MRKDPTCIFCKIVSGEIPSSKLLETDSVIAFLDIAPVTPGHALLTPKEHYVTLSETPVDLVTAMCSELPALTRAVKADAAGLNLVVNHGRAAGQEVDHVHFHLIPRHPGDDFRVHWPRGKYEGTAMEETRARIVADLARDSL